ncbi:hypothetical protein PV326_000969 [Microctonus aethiopoides]|nr:hypothetical protein PV326_000969 [Microctonus aethiopoides]
MVVQGELEQPKRLTTNLDWVSIDFYSAVLQTTGTAGIYLTVPIGGNGLGDMGNDTRGWFPRINFDTNRKQRRKLKGDGLNECIKVRIEDDDVSRKRQFSPWRGVGNLKRRRENACLTDPSRDFHGISWMLNTVRRRLGRETNIELIFYEAFKGLRNEMVD